MATYRQNLQYSAPLLPLDEIVKFARSKWDLQKLTKAELTNSADPSFVQEIYYYLAFDLTETVEGIYQARLSVDLDRADEMEIFVYLTNLYSIMNTLLKEVGYSDFRLSDLLSPKTKRTQLILSQLINFYNFLTSQNGHLDNVQGAMVELLQKKDACAEEAPRLQRKIGDVTNAITVAKEEQVLIGEQIVKSRQVLLEKCEVKRLNHEKKAAILAKLEEVTKDIATLQNTLEELKRLDGEWNERVAESPDELERQMAQRELDLRQARADTQQVRGRLEVADTQETCLRRWQADTTKLLKILRYIKVEMDRSKLVDGQAGSRDSRRQELSEQLADAAATRTKLFQDLIQQKELGQALQVKQQAKMKNIKSQVDEMKSNKASFQTNLSENYVVMDSIMEELSMLQIQLKETHDEMKAGDEMALHYHARCKVQLDQFNKKSSEFRRQLGIRVEELVAKIGSENTDS